MQFTLLTAVALFAVSALAADSVLYINSPTLTQCQVVKSSWSPGTGPYNLIAVPADNLCGSPLQIIGDTSTTVFNWTVAIPAGTKVVLSVADSEEVEGLSHTITVGASSDTSCLPAASSSGAASLVAGTGTTISPSVASTTGSTSDPTSSSNVAPIGAANAGSNSIFSSAPSARQASTPLLAFTAIAAIAALAL